MTNEDILTLQFSEITLNLRSTWDIYIKFYTVFLTVNFAALGVVAEKIVDQSARKLIATAFIGQNILSGLSAICVTVYSSAAWHQQQAVLKAMLSLGESTAFAPFPTVGETSIPYHASVWGGVANATSHVFFILCWIAIVKMNTRQASHDHGMKVPQTQK